MNPAVSEVSEATTAPEPLAASLLRWRSAATARLPEGAHPAHFEEIGRVHATGDGIAEIRGLAGVRLGELLRFSGDRMGYAASLNADSIACVLLDDSTGVAVGDAVRRTGDVVQVPVGEALLGRVVDPLGRPLDGRGPVASTERLPAERPAPGVLDRALVQEQVHTGTLAIDALFPLGRGQRELLIGDRGTGKTAIALDAVLAQKNSELVCVYVCVGQPSESAAAVVAAIEKWGAPDRCIVVVASGSAAPGLQWLAPFSGFSMAEWFRDRGGHALVVVDDLSQHAATHRELALLMQQPPGREAYPGDIFHVHARLLERAAMLSPERGGGSLTALPVACTEAGNLSAYIPTNLISITDGQIALNARQFELGQLPAVDTGLSVSRIGGKTQAPLMRAAVAQLRLAYAQFLELEGFSRFGTELDARVQAQIARGRLIRTALGQPQLAPQNPALQVALMIALQAGLLDAGGPQALPAKLTQLGAAIDADPALAAALRTRGKVPPGLQERLRTQLAQVLGELPTAVV